MAEDETASLTEQDMNLSQLREILKERGSLVCCMQFMGLQRVGHDLANEPRQQQNFKILLRYNLHRMKLTNLKYTDCFNFFMYSHVTTVHQDKELF